MKITFFCKFLLVFALLTHVPTILPMQKCNTCDKARSNGGHKKTNLDHLMKKHSQCPWCNDIQKFSNKIDLLTHMKTQHPNEKIYCCPGCLYFSVRPYEVRKHMGLTDQRGALSCYALLKIFFNNALPKIHSNSCHYCNYYFTTEIEVMSHYLHNHSIWLYGIRTIIDQAYPDNSIMINIQSLKIPPHDNHNNNRALATIPHDRALENSDYYQCATCASIFTNSYTFVEHLTEECQPSLNT